jgi:hypothetical protein
VSALWRFTALVTRWSCDPGRSFCSSWDLSLKSRLSPTPRRLTLLVRAGISSSSPHPGVVENVSKGRLSHATLPWSLPPGMLGLLKSWIGCGKMPRQVGRRSLLALYFTCKLGTFWARSVGHEPATRGLSTSILRLVISCHLVGHTIILRRPWTPTRM